MQIWLVENDSYIGEQISKEFKRTAGVDIKNIGTELDFRTALSRECDPFPELVVLDVMLPWTRPGRAMVDAPAEVREGGLYKAGFRCFHLFRQHSRAPIIFYTALSRSDVELIGSYDYLYLPKDLTDLRPLVKLSIETISGYHHGSYS